MIKNFKWLLLVSLTFVACDNNDEITTVPDSSDGLPLTAGSADFAKYVALGDSFAAGYSDGALFVKGQEGAYPNVLAQQFALVGGGAFTTPLMADNIGGFLFMGNVAASPRLYFNGSGPVPVSGRPTTEITTRLTGTFNNMGIPGAKSFHLIAPNYGAVAGVPLKTANPYFARFASSATTTVLADVATQLPTFFSLWIGGNDVLGYALAGGVPKSQDPVNGDDITPAATFDFVYSTLITKLTEKGAKGVVANLPYVSNLPYFTTVKYNAVPLAAAQVAALNSGYAAYNGGLMAAKNLNIITEAERLQRTINFIVGQNPVVIVDEYLTDITMVNPGLIKMRQATAMDYILLSSGGVSAQVHLAGGNGTAAPLSDKWVLSKNELSEIVTATDAYNLTIKAVADAKGLAFVDTKAIMNQLVNGGISGNGFTVTAAFVTGGGFSLDGVHPSPRGYALIANKFIEAINTTYGSNLKGVDLSNYRILFPSTL
ncbi:G-D-S-L family lipolytic protein [Flavobacterium sp. ZB4P13]|uniref:G-D-S-L family lipolytic protein n=1 Tax=Flavobacterium sp. ZB4P13 TaxID=3401728 RepID=UPI003AAFF2FF